MLPDADGIEIVAEGPYLVQDGFPLPLFAELKSMVENAVRVENGEIWKSDPQRLVPLFLFMNPDNRMDVEEFGTEHLHVYIYPFIGNTSQGNAMRQMSIPEYTRVSYGFHTVVGAWTNKHNSDSNCSPEIGGDRPCGVPVEAFIVEGWNEGGAIDRGSLSRTIAHEVGHVLSLSHNDNTGNGLMGPGSEDGDSQGYSLTEEQIMIARQTARRRIDRDCMGSGGRKCGYNTDFSLFE
jgi:hypothetical protein